MQTILGLIMLWMSFSAQTFLDNVRLFGLCLRPGLGRSLLTLLLFGMHLQAVEHIYVLTAVFTSLVIIAATQGNVEKRTPSEGHSDLLNFS
jgi:hypothetical protein